MAFVILQVKTSSKQDKLNENCEKLILYLPSPYRLHNPDYVTGRNDIYSERMKQKQIFARTKYHVLSCVPRK